MGPCSAGWSVVEREENTRSSVFRVALVFPIPTPPPVTATGSEGRQIGPFSGGFERDSGGARGAGWFYRGAIPPRPGRAL